MIPQASPSFHGNILGCQGLMDEIFVPGQPGHFPITCNPLEMVKSWIPTMVNIQKKRWKTTIFELCKSTISTGSCSIANCNKLPEGKFGGFSIFFVVSQFFGKISMVFPFFFRGTTKSSENLRFCYCLKSH